MLSVIETRRKEMTAILCLDPGGTTGWAFIHYGENEEPTVVISGQITGGATGFIYWYTDIAEKTEWSETVCESFILRPGVHGADITPAYVIGALEGLSFVNPIPRIYQAPSQKKLCDDDALKRLGLYQKGKPHTNDAIRHGIIYLRTKRHLPTLRKGWPE